MLSTGATAPDFTLADQDGNPVHLADLRGKTVVLYFYPKADTPGCTVQACGVRDRRGDYEAANAVVLGVSPDPVAKVAKFASKYDLGFTLLADPDHVGRGGLRRVGAEVDVRAHLLGQPAHHVHHRSDGGRGARDPEGDAEDPRRRGARGDRGRVSG